MTRLLLCTISVLGLAVLPLPAMGGGEKDRLGFAKLAEGESKGCCPDRWTCIIDGPDKAMTVVKLSAITSISKQSYLLQGAQRILEVTIDTTGNNSIRFYCIDSARHQRTAGRVSGTRELLDKHTEGATRLPEKTYPEATHSHNIEFQLSSPEQVNRIYESATHAWVKNIPMNLRISN